MATLSRGLRKRLENAVTEAREVGEEAAAKALSALAIGDREPHRSMSAEQKALRSRLRAHGRQLGDSRHAETGTQGIDHLVAECAYEHWHRMLFARFLAENQLLLEPESGVAISIEEVKELARSRGKDWVALAGEFAVRMLPQVFRQDDPVLEVQFAPEDKKYLEDLLESLPGEVFTATDSLGWTYQFWQAERKDAINASGEKIGADELPAVTQLFTEDYMVDFLLDNTLGAWHAGKILEANPELGERGTSEDDLRNAVALPGCPWKYLRFLEGDSGRWRPAAGSFAGWPRVAEKLKCLDPCMGSGHFVIAMFERLVTLRMVEETTDEATAAAAVIRENLFGLEIDLRCTQIAAFNLALATWRRVGYRPLPAMNLACSGVAPNSTKNVWLKLAGDMEPLQRGMSWLYSLFKDAPLLGSLINPPVTDGDLLAATFGDLQPLLDKALARDRSGDEMTHELAVTALGVAKAADILADTFTLVATNVPFLKRGKQIDALRIFCEKQFSDSKDELATVFLERSLAFVSPRCSVAIVTPQFWTFHHRSLALRKKILRNTSIELLAILGTSAFETISGEVVNVGMFVMSNTTPSTSSKITGLETIEGQSYRKAEELLTAQLLIAPQLQQLTNPDSRILFGETSRHRLLSEYADTAGGLQTFDKPRFMMSFWELSEVDGENWLCLQSTVTSTVMYGGREQVLLWENGDGQLRAYMDALAEQGYTSGVWRAGVQVWGKQGVLFKLMGDRLEATLYTGQPFENTTGVLIPHNHHLLPALWCYCSDALYSKEVRKIDKKVAVTNGSLSKVPFDIAHWKSVAAERYPMGLPKPYSSDPTQWLFNGHPKDSDQPLQVSIARLLDYSWPRQTGSSFPDCPALDPDGLEKFADNDGIVCLSATKGEAPADERIREVLARSYGKEWDAAVLEQLLAQVGFSGKTLADWLRDGFFEQHCALFHQRPFIWHIWDGERDGFHALANYHKLTAPDAEGRKTLEKLTYSYLGDWITRQKAEQKQGQEGADAKVAAALHLQEGLKKILDGEPPYDLFARWKPLHGQPIGWEPDINDGVRINIRPFMIAGTLKGKSIFRKAPKIKWDKDRGKEPSRSKRDFPWFWSWDEEAADFKGGPAFDGNRWNDLHYSNEIKEAALEGAEKKR
jgi:hypothetical protein